MEDKKVQMLIKLREFTRAAFDGLEGKQSPLAQMRVQDTAWTLSSIVNSIDDVLKDHVKFEKK